MAAGWLLCGAWYYTILTGTYILYCPVLYLMFFNHQLYRKVVDVLFGFWELYPVALFQCCAGTEIHHHGDYVNGDENTIIVMNHCTRVDWNYIWMGLYHATQDPDAHLKCICKENPTKVAQKRNIVDNLLNGRSRIKFVLKDEIKAVPGMGWIMQLNFFLYVKRCWRDDQLSLAQFADYYRTLGSGYRVVLFPEGTDLSEQNRRRSEQFALAHNLQRYEHVLHPRTTGFAVLHSRLSEAGLASVYDATVIYDKPANEADLLRGNLPGHVHFHFKRYSIDQLPTEEEALRTWLNDRWRDKETLLKNFHSEGIFYDPVSKRVSPEREPRSLTIAKIGFVFWTILDFLFAYWLYYSVIFRFWVIYHSLLFASVTWFFGGFQNIQYKLLCSI